MASDAPHDSIDQTALAPTVGMGATILHYSDRTPATVVEVRTPNLIVIQRDTCRRADNHGMSEIQRWLIASDPKGKKHVVSRRKDGTWRIRNDGTPVHLGDRERYYDFSF